MNILVTGGLGFIGSHTVVELLESGHEAIIVDNLYNSKVDVFDKICQITGKSPGLFIADATDAAEMDDIFSKHQIDGVIHFAGFKAVGESVSKPLEYYRNNLVSAMVVAEKCVKYKVNRFVFSSSATVYGEQEPPLKEDSELMPTSNPYGETKAMIERILTDVAKANPEFSVCLLRYFNPVGAHKSGLIGEDPNGIPNNLMPFVLRVARGEIEKLNVFGDDYDTPDGTGVRDYIHVVDLARGHLKAIEKDSAGVSVYNLGTGSGTSVLELVNTFIRVNGVDVPYEIVGRRDGDVATCYADVTKSLKELGFKAEYGIEDMVRDAWQFEKNKC
ncbi:MAG TPA: UDP-glucose 4-epimerase GalE [Clostridiales bacterium]|jgi:UDP-glucose 4-epimerase|nr:UDP-glucose 4-epimerase GalE [Clostridiales bacterium]